MARYVDLNNRKEKKGKEKISILNAIHLLQMSKPQIQQAEKLKRGLKYIGWIKIYCRVMTRSDAQIISLIIYLSQSHICVAKYYLLSVGLCPLGSRCHRKLPVYQPQPKKSLKKAYRPGLALVIDIKSGGLPNHCDWHQESQSALPVCVDWECGRPESARKTEATITLKVCVWGGGGIDAGKAETTESSGECFPSNAAFTDTLSLEPPNQYFKLESWVAITTPHCASFIPEGLLGGGVLGGGSLSPGLKFSSELWA